MAFDFDEVIDRRGTHSSKWDSLGPLFGLTGPDAIPMWVADMDFAAPPSVLAALETLIEQRVFGYFGDFGELNGALSDWLTTRHGWTPDPGWIGWSHGLVAGIGFCVNALTERGEGVVVFSPVYHAFGRTIRAAGRDLIESRLINEQGRYRMDLETLDRELPAHARIVVLCSPHNPGGRVWTADELRELADFCRDRDLILISDEIHCDLVFPGATHQVMAKVAPDILDRLILMTAPTKTFNLASALTGATIIPNAEIREKVTAFKMGCGSNAVNRVGAAMATAAYQGGADWLDALIPYLQGNRDFIDRAVAERLPGVRSMPLEATYLSWLDFSGTGLPPDEVVRRVEKVAQIAVNKGPTFGAGGESWLRFNFACPRATVERAMDRLAEAFAAS